METFYKITFLLPPALLETALAQLPAEVQIGIYIDEKNKYKTDSIYQALFYKRAKHTICIAVPAGIISDTELTGAIIPLFNHPLYNINKKMPGVILVYDNEAEQAGTDAVTEFSDKARAQGWAGIRFTNFFKVPYITQRGSVFSLSIQSIEQLENITSGDWLLDVSDIAGAEFVIKADELKLAPSVMNAFSKLEEALIAKNRKLYDASMQLFRMEKELKELKEQSALAKQQLADQRRHYEMLKATQETERILNFYHAEYEVLPLWYKRFGHIIKVLTGKRSLQSLFNDAAKTETGIKRE